MLLRLWRKGNPSVLSVGMQAGAATVENSMEFPQKIKIGAAFWPSDPTSGNISEGTQITSSKEHKQSYVHCSVIYNHQVMEAAQVPTNRWVDKTTMGYLYHRILLGHKIEASFTLWKSMDGPGGHYFKCNKPVRERQIPYDFTHTWNLMNKLKEQVK